MAPTAKPASKVKRPRAAKTAASACPALTPKFIEAMLEQLSAAGYRFTREFIPPVSYARGLKPLLLQRALILDTETTGLDKQTDKIIELGLVLVEFCPETGQAYDVLERFNGLEDPGMPISPDAIKVHHVTDDMVKGLRIDDAEVDRLVALADIVIAHNANFDRSLAEARWPSLANKAWACSQTQIPWQAEGLGSSKLEFIAYRQGFHFTGHRAVADCEALLEVLQHPLPESGKLAMKALLDVAFEPAFEVWPMNSGYASKDQLKARKYQWRPEPDKVWVGTVESAALDTELDWLGQQIYQGRPATVELGVISAYNRFTSRRDKRQPRRVNEQSPQLSK